jgi:hypothetical protein
VAFCYDIFNQPNSMQTTLTKPLIKSLSKKLSGLDDPHVDDNLWDLVQVSGDQCIEKLDKMLRRITPKRFYESVRILRAIRYFGGRIQILHQGDLDKEDLEYCWCYSEKGSDTLGTYRHIDAWVTIPLDRHNGWATVEETLRHECFHLLQDVCDTRPRVDDRDLPLLSDKLKWGGWLAECVLEEHDRQEAFADSADDVTPLCEIEAHAVDTWPKTFADWVREVKKEELWAHRWYCPL